MKFNAMILVCALIFGVGCRTTQTLPDGTTVRVHDPVKSEKLKAAFKPAVATAVLIAVREEPKSYDYFRMAGGAICELHDRGEYTPAAILAALDKTEIKELQTLEALAARNFVHALYEVHWADRFKADIPANSFAAGLLEVLCQGIASGLQQASDLNLVPAQ